MLESRRCMRCINPFGSLPCPSISIPLHPPLLCPFTVSNTCRNSRGRWLAIYMYLHTDSYSLLHIYIYIFPLQADDCIAVVHVRLGVSRSAWCSARPGTCILQHRARRTDTRRDLLRRSRMRSPKWRSSASFYICKKKVKKTAGVIVARAMKCTRSRHFFLFHIVLWIMDDGGATARAHNLLCVLMRL